MPMPTPLTMTDDDEIFVSFIKRSSHSSLIFGVKQADGIKLLCHLGKGMDIFSRAPKSAPACSFFEGYLHSETLFDKRRSRNNQAINYLAMAISYEQYIAFINELAYVIPTSSATKIQAYQPTTDSPHLNFRSIQPKSHQNSEQLALRNKLNSFGLNTECRSTAIDLYHTINQPPPLNGRVSRFYFCDLPFKAQIPNSGIKDIKQFYILPLPPEKYAINDKKLQHHIAQIYRRLKKIMHSQSNDELSFNKFSKLKKLYTNILSQHKINAVQQSSLNLLNLLTTFSQQEGELINSLRHRYFFDRCISRTTKTGSMLDKLISQCKDSSDSTDRCQLI